MADFLDVLLFDDELSSEERETLRARIDEDPSLSRTWAHWARARAHLHAELHEQISDRRLLVLYVLDQEGDEAALTESEHAALDAVRDDLTRAIDESPALQQIVERIREERSDFEDAWSMHEEEAVTAEVPTEQSAEGPPDEREEREPKTPRSQQGSDLPQTWTRRFALVTLIIGIAVGAFLFWPESTSTNTVIVEEGVTRTIDLGNGSTARVVGEATLTYPTEKSGAQARRVTLRDGRAFFDVQPRMEDAPFVVRTPAATATVLGTQFGVTTTSDTTEIVLASGSVRVGAADEAADKTVVLEPGQTSWVASGAPPASPTDANLADALEWTGLFVFRSVPMETIAERLRARYDVSIVVDEAVASEPVTGTFDREQSAEQVLDVLAATLGAEVQQQGTTYRVVPSR